MCDGKMEAYTFPSYISLSDASCGRNFAVNFFGRHFIRGDCKLIYLNVNRFSPHGDEGLMLNCMRGETVWG